MTDGQGVPLGAPVSVGQAHASKYFETLMDTVRIRRRRPIAVAGDQGDSDPRTRSWLSQRGIEAVIPNPSNQPAVKINEKKYRGRNAIERCIG